MEVRRLDLGAEVVHVPSRDLLVIHSDLEYGEAIGAVAGTLPGIHPDAVVGLVEQVTPRPRPEPWLPKVTSVLARGAVASLVAALAAVVYVAGFAAPVQAEARFGETFQHQMAAMGLSCRDLYRGDSAQHCYKGNEVFEVRGYVRRDASLYVLDQHGDRTSVLIFENDTAAAKFEKNHPRVVVAGRVAIW